VHSKLCEVKNWDGCGRSKNFKKSSTKYAAAIESLKDCIGSRCKGMFSVFILDQPFTNWLYISRDKQPFCLGIIGLQSPNCLLVPQHQWPLGLINLFYSEKGIMISLPATTNIIKFL